MKFTSWEDVQKTLEVEATEFLDRAYGIELDIPIVINSRLKSTYGCFKFKPKTREPLRIEIGKNYIENQKWETVIETLIHECIHYALYVQNLPYRDGHPLFEAELKKHGSHSTGTVKYHGKVVQYDCPSCGKVYQKKKRYPRNQTYKSGCCRQPIRFIGEKIV
ncbi:SprT-like domain-containing protein [Viridibacillus arvi]|uniref:SprT-like domain-containing protein n=1 Tax=Viridibacillus arvi TaxID=263475 RepID=UPI0034CE532A